MRLYRPLDKDRIVRIAQRFNPPEHYGIDFSCVTGTPIYASVDGTAYVANQTEGFGLYVRIETPEYKVYTTHLNAAIVQSGQVVSRGQIIGYSGNTGNSTGPHLHFEVRCKSGSPYKHGAIDPWPLIDWEGKDMNKLGIHFQQLPPWHTRVVNEGTCQWVKMINPSGPYPYARQVNVIGRVWIGGDHVEQALIDQREEGADRYFEMCLPHYREAPWVTVWEGPNEPLPFWGRLQNLAAFSQHWVRRMHDAGLRCAVGGFSVGQPEIGTMHVMGPAIAMADFWFLHEYSQPTMQTDAGWLCLRYRKAYEELRRAGFSPPPLLITECGIDGGAVTPQRQHEARPKKGWKTFATWPQYQEQLAWYAREIAKDPYVVAATPFVSGAVQDPEHGWPDFDLNEEQTRWIATLRLPEEADKSPVYLPSSDPLTIAADTVPAIIEKGRWWLEEEQRQRERGNTDYADRIRRDVINLMYRAERMAKG